MEALQPDILIAKMLLSRLEHISADSHWAHRASGIRGNLLHSLEKIENGESVDIEVLKQLVEQGFIILEKAAKAQKS